MPRVYGPVPTGLASVNVAGLLTEPQTDCGRIARPAMFSRFMYWAVGKFTVTVSPLVVTMEMSRPPRLIAACFLT